MTVLPTTLAAGAALAAALLMGPTGLASVPALGSTAAGDPSAATTTITVDTAALNRFCDERLPLLLSRAQDRLGRIQGDASTVGSVLWTQARAEDAEAAGHTDQAARLRLRADQRSGRVDDVTAAITRIETVKTQICDQRTGA